MKALDISAVTFSYEQAAEFALQNFSLSVARGEAHALLGPNGAGKTTLMRVITGQLRGYAGEVFIYGNKAANKDSLSNIGYAPQPISLFPSPHGTGKSAVLRQHGRVDLRETSGTIC